LYSLEGEYSLSYGYKKETAGAFLFVCLFSWMLDQAFGHPYYPTAKNAEEY